MRHSAKDGKGKYKLVAAWVSVAVLLIGCFGVVMWSSWERYKTDIIDEQKEQMLIIAELLAEYLQETVYGYQGDMEWLSGMLDDCEQPESMDRLLRGYLQDENDYVVDIVYRDTDGTVLWCNQKLDFQKNYGQYQLTDSDVWFGEWLGNDGQIYFTLKKVQTGGRTLELVIDMGDYYRNLVSDIELGANGYIVVKNSQGIIVMHPEKKQLGENVITGREQMYPGVNLDDLEELVRLQNEEKSGVYEYYSYWWSDKSLPRVKKIAAHDKAFFGDEYMIVSAVMDYSDIYDPIAKGFISISMMFFVILLATLGVTGVGFYYALQRQKNEEEIEYLKNLNQVLKETQLEAEAIAHQQRLQIMGTMTGGIAHEFNNLLTPIMGYAEMLLDELPPDSEKYEYAEEIFMASDKAKDIVRQISGLSRKNMETVFHFIPIKKMLQRGTKMIYSICPRNIQLLVDVNEVEAEDGFLGNETQINQVLLNCAVNAFQAIGKEEDGVVRIQSELLSLAEFVERTKIKNVSGVERFICIRIEDNGCGMKEETLEQIFTPFFTTKTGGQHGTGLGLVVVEQIISSHRGYVLVESEYGTGTRVSIYLPAIKQKATEQTLEQEGEKQLKILVVDDNGKILKLMERRFKMIGVEVCGVQDTKQAREKLKCEKYDVLLLDQNLSRAGALEDGIYLAMQIQGRYPDMIIIVMVDQVRKEVIEAKQHGIIDAYLHKPVSDTEIIDAIRKIER